MLSFFKDNIWSIDLSDKQSISKYNKGFRLLLRVIDIFIKYLWVVPLKDKKCITITNDFQKILDESGYKPNKMCVDKGSIFCNRTLKSWLHENDIEVYSKHNKEKSVVGKRFIRTLMNKINKYTTSIPKNMCIDKLDNMVNEYNNTYHRTNKMNPVDVNFNRQAHVLTLI